MAKKSMGRVIPDLFSRVEWRLEIYSIEHRGELGERLNYPRSLDSYLNEPRNLGKKYIQMNKCTQDSMQAANQHRNVHSLVLALTWDTRYKPAPTLPL